ncbi:hypothetical protein D3C85_884320 [compost metagenome]
MSLTSFQASCCVVSARLQVKRGSVPPYPFGTITSQYCAMLYSEYLSIKAESSKPPSP